MRYEIRTNGVPKVLRDRGFVAFVHDKQHPDDREGGCSVSWHQSVEDAHRTCDALNYAARMLYA